jgi:hypothetical protein
MAVSVPKPHVGPWRVRAVSLQVTRRTTPAALTALNTMAVLDSALPGPCCVLDVACHGVLRTVQRALLCGARDRGEHAAVPVAMRSLGGSMVARARLVVCGGGLRRREYHWAAADMLAARAQLPAGTFSSRSLQGCSCRGDVGVADTGIAWNAARLFVHSKYRRCKRSVNARHAPHEACGALWTYECGGTDAERALGHGVAAPSASSTARGRVLDQMHVPSLAP